ncbi:hypothetical protein CCP4SC76_4530028 [Gammaproteobacteria bacterium]
MTVRYKDLVQLRNGVARSRLALPQGLRPRGSLERNVLKNLLAWRLAQAAEQAGDALRRHDIVGAGQVLTAQRELLQDLQKTVPGWADDLELARDQRLLASYLSLLTPPTLARQDMQNWVADSLDLAAFRRLVPTAP